MTDEESTTRAEVIVTGVVQGVGFRPFVYRTAVARDLTGTVKNLGDAGVEIVLEGSEADVDDFLTELREDPPPLSRVDSVEVGRSDPEGEDAFEIVRSAEASGGSGTIPPDTGMCDNCLADMRDPDSRYYGYWATSCVDCGPRYTVIRGLPYDRPRTSMDEFPMCEDCREEYEDPADRRYHAQTIACPQCGPSLSLVDPDGKVLADGSDAEAIEAAADRLRAGEQVAIKGIGGSHLACDATDPEAVETLRERTGRPSKPFALMAPDLETIESFADVSDAEREALETVRRPIVLLEQSADGSAENWLDEIAPGLHTVGVMLPYSGLHHRLFDHVDGPLVMTSANLPGRPMATTKDAILARLGDVIDAALVHDREIVARSDDSVVRFSGDGRRFIRRSRGWVPEELPLPGGAPERPVLAVGAEFDATIAVTQDDVVIPSQFVGDVDNPSTVAFLRETIDHLTDLTGVEPRTVACDMHPEFLTTEVAEDYAGNGVIGPMRVQHHHAHAASLLAEHDRERAIVITADGTGYGPDGSVWGGEVLDAWLEGYDRVGGLDTFHLPGGTAAVEKPARILASLLEDEDRIDDLLVERGAVDSTDDAATIRQQLDQGVNAPETTSAGRTLDAVSALLDVCTGRGYEGEPAMRLEAAAAGGTVLDYEVPFATRDGDRVVDVSALVQDADRMVTEDGHAVPDVAATVQDALARGLADIAIEAAQEKDLDAVGFSGGVAYNDAITRAIREAVEDADLEFLGHDRVPPGDGGIAYGQAVIASVRQ
ncbi:MAG TPA: carbamoyltransferase HypF [Natrialbaceae archaeon]|nr:carbamoyltransferase HypF [Natrialbaceae archaeon]